VGWLYIFIRTYPFWAFPLGIALITAAFRLKKGNGRRKQLYLLSALILMGSSGYFLWAKGHEEAVPFFHHLMYGPR